MFSAWWTCSASGRSPKLSSTRLAAHSLTFGDVLVGDAEQAEDDERGQLVDQVADQIGARVRRPSGRSCSTAISRISARARAIRRGVNAFLMKPRRRVWSGGWIPDRPLEECVMPPSSKTRWTSGGRGLYGDWVFSDENVAGSLKIVRMSS